MWEGRGSRRRELEEGQGEGPRRRVLQKGEENVVFSSTEMPSNMTHSSNCRCADIVGKRVPAREKTEIRMER